jgi:hypothetical protein
MSGGVTCVIPSESRGIPLRSLKAIAAGWKGWPWPTSSAALQPRLRYASLGMMDDER